MGCEEGRVAMDELFGCGVGFGVGVEEGGNVFEDRAGVEQRGSVMYVSIGLFCLEVGG